LTKASSYVYFGPVAVFTIPLTENVGVSVVMMCIMMMMMIIIIIIIMCISLSSYGRPIVVRCLGVWLGMWVRLGRWK